MTVMKPQNPGTAWSGYTVVLLGSALSLNAQDTASSIPESSETSVTLWSLFQQGGWAMYPLLALSVALVGLVVYCALLIKDARFTQPEVAGELQNN